MVHEALSKAMIYPVQIEIPVLEVRLIEGEIILLLSAALLFSYMSIIIPGFVGGTYWIVKSNDCQM